MRAEPTRETGERFVPLALAALLVLGAVLLLVGLDRSPVVWIDEVFYAEPARQLAAGGGLTSPIFFDVRGLDRQFFLQPPVHFLVQSVVYRLFGFSQEAVRAPSVLYYLLSILLVHSIVRGRLRGRPDGWVWALLASAFFTFDKTIIREVRGGRSTGLAILLMLASLHLWNRQDELGRRRALALSAGLGCLAALTHPVAAFLIVGYLLDVVFNERYEGQRTRVAGTFLSVLLLCSVPYLAQVVLGFDAWRDQLVSHGLGGGGLSGPAVRGLAILATLGAEFALEPLALVLVLVALLARDRARVRSVFLPCASVAVLATVSPQPLVKFVVPFAYVTVFVSLPHLADRLSGSRSMRRGLYALVLLAFVNVAGLTALRFALTCSQYELSDPARIDRVVDAYVPARSRVLSVPITYYACLARQIEFRYPGPLYGVSIEVRPEDVRRFQAAVRRYRPDFLILKTRMDPRTYFGFLGQVEFVLRHRYQAALKSRIDAFTGDVDFCVWRVVYP